MKFLPHMACFYLDTREFVLGGSIQFELSYTKIFNFDEQTHNLYKYSKITCIIKDPKISIKLLSYTSYNVGKFLLNHQPNNDRFSENMLSNRGTSIPLVSWTYPFYKVYTK